MSGHNPKHLRDVMVGPKKTAAEKAPKQKAPPKPRSAKKKS